MYYPIKVRLYPTLEQKQIINRLLGCYRFVYNICLQRKKEFYDKDKTNLSVLDLSRWYHNTLIKDPEYEWLRQQNTQVMKQAIQNLDNAYQQFFKHGKGFPKFKSKKDKQSAKFTRYSISRKNTFLDRHVTLIKSLKNIEFRCSNKYLHYLQKYKDNIKSANISKTKSGNFFLTFVLELSDNLFKRFQHTGKKVGIDLGVKDFIITSDGLKFTNNQFFKKSEDKIRHLHKELSKKSSGSHNREKTRIKLARAYEKIANQRTNYINHVVNELLSNYDSIYMEDLNVSGMLQNHNLSKAIQDVGFYKFKITLINKATYNNKEVKLINRFYPSSKLCSNCGYKNTELTLKDREWVCPVCGEHHDRDINAALNILKEGEK